MADRRPVSAQRLSAGCREVLSLYSNGGFVDKKLQVVSHRSRG